MCLFFFNLYMCMHTVFLPDVFGVQKRVLNSRGLAFWTVASCYMGAGPLAQALCKSSKWF